MPPLLLYQHILIPVALVTLVRLTLSKVRLRANTTERQRSTHRSFNVILISTLISLVLLWNQLAIYSNNNNNNITGFAWKGGTRGGIHEIQAGKDDIYERYFILPLEIPRGELNKRTDASVNTESVKAEISKAVQVETRNDYADTNAIFLISFGKEAEKGTLVERCILSLRRRGRYTGFIVLLTDAPLSRYEQIWNEKDNVIVMNPKEQHFNGADGKPLKFNRETLSLKAKRFKTFVLDYFDTDKRLSNILFVYYLDIDIVAGGNINHLFSEVETKHHIEDKHNAREAKLSTLHFFTPINKEYPFQSGTFVVKRSSSRRCLELWRREIDKIVEGSLGMDQAALRTVYQQIEAGEETKCNLVRMENEDFLSFPKPSNFDQIAQSSSYTTLIHLSNSKFARWIDEEKQNTFLNRVLQLSGEEIQSGKYGKAVIKLT